MFTRIIMVGVILQVSLSHGQSQHNFSADIIRNDQRNEQLRSLVNPVADELSGAEKKVTTQSTLESVEDELCFPIDHIELSGEYTAQFQKYLTTTLRKINFHEGAGRCIGFNGINFIQSQVQNEIIAQGYVTSRILVAPQDLNQRKLTLSLLAGKLRNIRADHNPALVNAYRPELNSNVFPLKSGELFNLRAIEQGLENLERVPTASVTMEIEPSEHLNESDIVVAWQQRDVPYRLTLSADDSGSRETGKNQGSITFSADSIFGFSELLYLSLNREFGHKSKRVDTTSGRKVSGGTDGYAFHFSVPYKNWLLDINASKYRYSQAVAGAYEIYNYNGDSRNSDISLSRLLYRDSQRKTTVSIKGWQRASRSYIDDAELTIQRRKVAGWQVSLNHREHINRAVLDLGVSYKRGTGAVHSLRAPEEAEGEGTSRIKILLLDANLGVPFTLGQQNFYFNSSLHGQWSHTPLTSQDRIAIGGRYTVRGFDGDMTLMAERGFYVRNDLAWAYKPSHQAYIALDGGYVSGPSSQWLAGQKLIGTAIGIKGQFNIGGQLSYDVFAGLPLKKPKQQFKTKKVAFGFSLSYSF